MESRRESCFWCFPVTSVTGPAPRFFSIHRSPPLLLPPPVSVPSDPGSRRSPRVGPIVTPLSVLTVSTFHLRGGGPTPSTGASISRRPSLVRPRPQSDHRVLWPHWGRRSHRGGGWSFPAVGVGSGTEGVLPPKPSSRWSLSSLVMVVTCVSFFD